MQILLLLVIVLGTIEIIFSSNTEPLPKEFKDFPSLYSPKDIVPEYVYNRFLH